MKRLTYPVRLLVFGTLSLLLSLGHAEPTKEQLNAQQDAYPAVDEKIGDTLTPKKPVRPYKWFDEYERLDRHFQLMDQYGNDATLRQSLTSLQESPDTARRAMSLYRELSERQAVDNGYYGEARWRTLYLLGDVKGDGVEDFLYEIAASDMPDARKVGEYQYRVEYRLRARAIAGLEKHKDIEALQRIYKKNTLASGLAAASLYELGYPPDGIVAIDAVKNLGYGDPTDYNKRKGTPGPVSPTQRFRPTPADEPEPISPKGHTSTATDTMHKATPAEKPAESE